MWDTALNFFFPVLQITSPAPLDYLRDKIRQIENDWFQRKAEEAEKYSQEKNHHEFFAALNAVYGPRARISHQIRSIERNLLSSTEDTKKRWVEHFKNLLNQPSHYHQDIVNDIAQLPTVDNLDSPIMMDELDTALNNTKLGKSPGPNEILPEILVFGGD